MAELPQICTRLEADGWKWISEEDSRSPPGARFQAVSCVRKEQCVVPETYLGAGKSRQNKRGE